jgi:hypothetical protein
VKYVTVKHLTTAQLPENIRHNSYLAYFAELLRPNSSILALFFSGPLVLDEKSTRPTRTTAAATNDIKIPFLRDGESIATSSLSSSTSSRPGSDRCWYDFGSSFWSFILYILKPTASASCSQTEVNSEGQSHSPPDNDTFSKATPACRVRRGRGDRVQCQYEFEAKRKTTPGPGPRPSPATRFWRHRSDRTVLLLSAFSIQPTTDQGSPGGTFRPKFSFLVLLLLNSGLN